MSRPSTEDKDAWIKTGQDREREFVEICRFYYDLDVSTHPEPYEPDLILQPGKLMAELKSYRTPFYTAERSYGVPAQWAFTYNVRDHKRYKQTYPNVRVFFWLCWRDQLPEFDPVSFMDMCIWGSLDYIDKLVRNAPVHPYRRREGDKVNKTRGYVLDARHFAHRIMWLAWDDVHVLKVANQNYFQDPTNPDTTPEGG